MELLACAIVLLIVHWLSNLPARMSHSRRTPPGYRHDFEKGAYDIAVHGKDYFYKQHLAGKYDVPEDREWMKSNK